MLEQLFGEIDNDYISVPESYCIYFSLIFSSPNPPTPTHPLLDSLLGASFLEKYSG